jgi:hypothetical protein
VSATRSSILGRDRGALSLPPPDTPGGLALAGAFALAVLYGIVLVSVYPQMVHWGPWIASISLVIGLLATFALATMVGNDIAAFQRLDLDLAETVLASPAGGPPAPEAPLAAVWRAYVTTSEESRRVARVHAYAFGPFLVGTVLSVASLLLVGLGTTITTNNVVGLGLVVEGFAILFLFAGGVAMLLTVGYAAPVPTFDFLAAKRWRRNAPRHPAVDEALASVPWLREFHRGTRESRPSSGSTILPAWLES